MSDTQVFISWSGNLSHRIAKTLYTAIQAHCPGVSPWVSSEIHPGKQWCNEIVANLRKSKMAIICITPENIHSSWLAFEAGAIAAKFKDSVVVPYLWNLRPTDLGKSPLANWQAIDATNEDKNQEMFGGLYKLGNPQESKQADITERLLKFWGVVQGEHAAWGDSGIEGGLVPATILNAVQELHEVSGNLTRTHYGETFPGFIDTKIIPCVEHAKTRVLIACDFPAYGSFSDHLAYDRYSSLITKHRAAGTDVQIVIPNATKREELIRRQFGDNDENFTDMRTTNQVFREQLRAFQLRCGEEIKSYSDFVKRALGLQTLLIEDFVNRSDERAAVRVYEIGTLLSMHMWVADESSAFFSFPMLSPDTEEHGIRSHDPGLVQALISVWSNFRDQAQEVGTTN